QGGHPRPGPGDLLAGGLRDAAGGDVPPRRRGGVPAPDAVPRPAPAGPPPPRGQPAAAPAHGGGVRRERLPGPSAHRSAPAAGGRLPHGAAPPPRRAAHAAALLEDLDPA